MSEEQAQQEQQQEQLTAAESIVVIRFSGHGSAQFSVQFSNVTLTQALAGTVWLQERIRFLLEHEWQMQALAQAREQAELVQVQQMVRGGVS